MCASWDRWSSRYTVGVGWLGGGVDGEERLGVWARWRGVKCHFSGRRFVMLVFVYVGRRWL